MSVLPRHVLLELGAELAGDQRSGLRVEFFDDDAGVNRARLKVEPGDRNPLVRAIPPLAYAYAWSAEWARLAYPLIQLGHTYAAALMATSVPDIEIRPPWPTFYLAVPQGLVTLLSSSGEPEPIEALLVHVQHGRWTFVAHATSVEYSRITNTLDMMRGEVGESEGLWWAYGIEMEAHDDRAAICLSRLLLNACIAMSDPTAAKPIGKAHRPGQRSAAAPPSARVYELNRPVRVDCRQAVRDYVRGGARMPAVQWIVRGHWRNQAHGVGWTEHRMRWIEPYWKGADGAPIAVRPHELGDKVKA